VTAETSLNDLHFAVVVGIDHYPALTDLTSARHDARLFYDWLVDPCMGALHQDNIERVEASENVVSIDSARPTQRQVTDALEKVQCAVRKAVDGDPDAWQKTRLYVFVAGHGIKPADGGGALLMADATPSRLGYHVDLLKYTDWHRINGLFNEVFVFADCCRINAPCSYAYAPPFSDDPTGRETTTVLAYAARSGERAVSAMASDAGRGRFTRALLDALSGAAANRLGEITLASVENHICLSLGTQQIPEFIPRRSASIVRRVTPPARTVRFTFPTPFRGVVRLFQGTDAGTAHPVVGGELVLELTPGLVEIRPEMPAQGFPSLAMRIPAGQEQLDVNL
jgi:hypothetical protein